MKNNLGDIAGITGLWWDGLCSWCSSMDECKREIFNISCSQRRN